MTDQKRIRLTKVSDTGDGKEKGYWVEGVLIWDIEVGRRVEVLRDTKNGVKVTGVFSTSPLKKVETEKDGSLYLTTENSVWWLQYI